MVKRVMRKRVSKKRTAAGAKRRSAVRRRMPRSITTNTAAIRENYSIQVNDGSMVFFSTWLSQLNFDRAQAVAEAFQEYRMKYVKLTFRPSADTFTPAAGNIIPQLYFQTNKYQAIPPNATLGTLLDVGCRPIRFDDKNIVRAYKPCVLLASDKSGVPNGTNKIMTTPWLSTNANAQNPIPGWQADDTEHLGCIFYVEKPNPATPTIQYVVDVEVVFQFRRPNWGPSQAPVPPSSLKMTQDGLKPLLDAQDPIQV